MKRVLLIILCLVVLLSGCYGKNSSEKTDKIIGVWISCFELDNLLSSNDFKASFQKTAEELEKLFVTDVFIHVRPFADSIYRSDYFPLRKSVKDIEYDVFEYIINVFHKKNIRVHAWINPYRVKTGDTAPETLDKDSIIYKWIKDSEKASNIAFADGIYLNPASEEAVTLIINGVKEILEKYDVDGIHFDDYFYPTKDENFDKISFEEYKSKADTNLSLEDWRRNNVNSFISSIRLMKAQENEDIILSISPAASVDKNYDNLYADIKYWLDSGYADWIIPQLYFGFNYPMDEYKFEKLLKSWVNICESTETKLIIGLAPYKIGNDTDIETEEWKSGNIISKQAKASFKCTQGICLFSSSSLLGKSALQTKERQNLYKFLKQYIQ